MATARRKPTARRKTPSRKRRKGGRKVPLFFKFLALFAVLLALILYIHYRQPSPFTERVHCVDQLIQARLAQLEIPQGAIHKRGEQRRKGEQTWTFSRWEVTLPSGVAPQEVVTPLARTIREACPGAALTEARAPDGTWEVKVTVDNILAHHLIVRPSRLKPSPPRIAIVVDDLGVDRQVAEELLSLDASLTFSILPMQTHSRRIAKTAHAHGREVILHLPLEPRGFPLKDPGEGALFVAMGDRELVRQLRKDLDAVPYIAGVNNHMGSRFMGHDEKVRLVLEELKGRGLFFLDSRTSSNSTGYRIARSLALRTGERDVFLDNETGVKDIQAQVEHLIRIARKDGKAIGICHPYPATVTVLTTMIPRIKAQGIDIVPLSQVLD